MSDVTPEQMARVLVDVEYPREQVESALRRAFPEADVPTLVDDALERKERVDADLDRIAMQDAARARAAEHDLDQSIHE